MSGFDNGTTQGGVFFQAKQFGAISRGYGPPVPEAGVVGDLYIDVQTWRLFNKRDREGLDPWGHYLFVVPTPYRATLKWFSASAPGNDIGQPGDYCLLWAGYANYGMQPSVFGPKQTVTWPENGTGPGTVIAALGAGTVLPVGLVSEGAAINDSNSTQLVVVGLTSEAVLPVPVLAAAGDAVGQAGLQTGPAQISVDINSLYTAEDQNLASASTPNGEQDNISIAAVTSLTVPLGSTYAVISAIGGPLYATYDGSVPSSVHYAIQLGQGNQLPVQGIATLAAIRVIGTTMSVSYWKP